MVTGPRPAGKTTSAARMAATVVRLDREAEAVAFASDPGAALRLDVEGVIRAGGVLGRMLDAFVAAQLRPELAISKLRPRLHHLRTQQGRHEVDLVVELRTSDCSESRSRRAPPPPLTTGNT